MYGISFQQSKGAQTVLLASPVHLSNYKIAFCLSCVGTACPARTVFLAQAKTSSLYPCPVQGLLSLRNLCFYGSRASSLFKLCQAAFSNRNGKGTKRDLELPRWFSGNESASECRSHRRHWLNPGVRRVPWRRKWQTHLSILAWRIPWTEEPGGLKFMGLQRVEHIWRNWACMRKTYLRIIPSSDMRDMGKLTFLSLNAPSV